MTETEEGVEEKKRDEIKDDKIRRDEPSRAKEEDTKKTFDHYS